jgi:hypothetical protein
MKLHFSFSEWDENEVEVFRTLDDGSSYGEVIDVFAHFLSMAYGYPISLKVDHTGVSFEFNNKDEKEDSQMELDLQ